MEFLKEDIHTLNRLGLTPCQARIYLALVQLETSTIKTVSSVSCVAREHVYRAMDALYKLGFAKKLITTPTTYQAVPVNDALSFLMERRINETSELQSKTRDLLQRFIKKGKTTIQGEGPQFVLIPRKEVIAQERRKSIVTAQKTLVIVTFWKRYSRATLNYTDEFKKALKRGVEIRHVIEKPKDRKSLERNREILQVFMEYPSFKVRYFSAAIKTILWVVDKKEACIMTSPTDELNESPALWSNNPSLVQVVQDYFEFLWRASLAKIH